MVGSQHEGPGFNLTGRLVPFCVEFTCFATACRGQSTKYKVMHVRLTVESKLVVDVCVNSCLSLCASSATARQPVQGLPHLYPVTGIGSTSL